MTRTLRCGLAIIGASAAGLAAARSAARAGADVLLLEARPEVGVPAAPAIVGFDHLWPPDVPLPQAAVTRRLSGARLRASDGRGPLIAAPLAIVDRTSFDRHLLAEAQKSGARVETGLGQVGIRDDLTIETPSFDLLPEVVLFADGAQSLASRFLRPQRDPERIAWGAILEFEAPGDADTLALTFGPHAPGGRSQLTPVGKGRWSHWTFFAGDRGVAETLARRALEIDAALEGWRDVEARFVGVAPDPVLTIPRDLTAHRVLVAGGAAGQGGLEVGLASGAMAGAAAARRLAGDEGALRAYERAWRERYHEGYRRLRGATDAIARLTDDEVRALFGAWDGAELAPRLDWRAVGRRPRGVVAAAWAAWLAHARGN